MVQLFSFRGSCGLAAGVALIALTLSVAEARADGPHGDDGDQHGDHPVYQHHAFDRKRDDRRDFRHNNNNPMIFSPPVSAGWFQRPYPYHLDYYRMRYGGSYAPYFGNLYGPSPLPAYYGPYYGAYSGGYANGYPQPGYNGAPMEYPAAPGMMIPQGAVEEGVPVEQPENKSVTKSAGDPLPAPTP